MKLGKIMAALAVAASVSIGPIAQAAPSLAGGNIYSWPDIGTGMWAAVMVSFGTGAGRLKFPLTPAAEAARAAEVKKLAGSASCDPVGPIGIIGAGFPLKFYFTPGEIVIMSDMDALWVRHIYMDGKPHHNYGPTYEGYSVGHWEGQTLVIDTTNLSSKVNLTTGVPASATSHLVERYTLLSPDKMRLNLTVSDPAVMTGPWSMNQGYVRHLDWEIEDTFCGEGNRDAPDANGNEEVNLTPPTS
jgi:hypothetical protein